jgi:23S rRNA pseudouridine1911/1915/1917 synthase
LKVTAVEAGQRLDVFLAARLAVSRSRAQKLLETATVNGAAAKAKHVLKAGDEIAVGDSPPEWDTSRMTFAASLPDVALPPILYEDDYLIVLDKPRGLIVHPGAGEPQSTLVDVLRAHERVLSSVGPPERAGIVHRLDKETSGVMLVCKTDEAHWKVATDFAERSVTKTYTALVCGVPPSRGRIEAPIARHPTQRKKMAVVASGRAAITEYSVERSWPRFALLQIHLLTGRTHQIRVHLSYVGHPVAGDGVYGGLKRPLQTAPDEAVRAAIGDLPGQALHAARLAFTHPITGEKLAFEAALPQDMRHIINALDRC